MRRGIKRLSAMKRLSSAMLSSRRSVYIDSVLHRFSLAARENFWVGKRECDGRQGRWMQFLVGS